MMSVFFMFARIPRHVQSATVHYKNFGNISQNKSKVLLEQLSFVWDHSVTFLLL